MRSREMVIIAILMSVFCLAGCSESPQDVFKELKTAALAKDADTIWERLTPQTKDHIGKAAGGFFGSRAASGELIAFSADSRETREYFRSLVAGLDEMSVAYIQALVVAQSENDGPNVLLRLKSFRFQPPDKPLTFIRKDDVWLWDARAAFDQYWEFRNNVSSGGF